MSFKMKKMVVTAFTFAAIASAVNAYNPPAGAESTYELSSPKALAGANSVAGGSIYSAGADSIVVNPSLTAKEQRTNLNLGYTFLFSTDAENSKKAGSAVQLGILIPMKMFVFTGFVNGNFIPFKEMNITNNVNIHAGLSKEITDKLDIGLSINGGLLWDVKADWALCGNVGITYDMGRIAFLPDLKLGVSFLNLGKTYNVSNIGYEPELDSTAFPNCVTIKAGASVGIVKTDWVDFGANIDITTPLFQNAIIDIGLGCSVKDLFYINVTEKLNIAEMCANRGSYIPSVALGFKFAFKANFEYMAENGWSQSEMKVSAGYKNLYTSVNAISAGAEVYLGMKDETPPVIELWMGDDDE